MGVLRFLTGLLVEILRLLRLITSGVSDTTVQTWLRKRRGQSTSQSTLWGLVLLSTRSLITVMLIFVSALPVIVYVSMLALLAGPFAWLIWHLERLYVRFYGYFFGLIAVLSYFLVSGTGSDILVIILALAVAAPLALFVIVSFLNKLPFGGMGLLIIFWPVYIIGQIVLSLIFSNIDTPTWGELQRSLFVALMSIIVIVVVKIMIEKRRFPGRNQPSLTRMLVDAPFMIPYFFGQTAWELVRDTVKSLYKSLKDVLLHILLPVAAFGAACISLMYFTQWLSTYYTEAEFGYLLALELVLVLAFMLIWTAFALMFANVRQPDLWVIANGFTVDMFGVFLYIYPISFYTLVEFTDWFNYEFDPIFYATLATILVAFGLFLASMRMPSSGPPLNVSMATGQVMQQQDRMKTLLTRFPFLKILYNWWPLIFPLAGVLAYLSNPSIPSF